MAFGLRVGRGWTVPASSHLSIDDMVNIERTLMCACTALNNGLYLASGGRVKRKVRRVPALLVTVAGYRLSAQMALLGHAPQRFLRR
jgi:hypothetical protein